METFTDQKGRVRTKTGQYAQTLTDEDVRLIRALCDEADQLRERLKHLTNKAIAEKFGISPSLVDCYKHFKNRKRVW